MSYWAEKNSVGEAGNIQRRGEKKKKKKAEIIEIRKRKKGSSENRNKNQIQICKPNGFFVGS